MGVYLARAGVGFWYCDNLEKKNIRKYSHFKMSNFFSIGPLICEQHIEYSEHLVKLRNNLNNNNGDGLCCKQPEEFLHLAHAVGMLWRKLLVVLKPRLFQTAVYTETGYQPATSVYVSFIRVSRDVKCLQPSRFL